MNIVIKCGKCGLHLPIKETHVNVCSDVEVRVEPCTNIDCYNCSECETDKKLKAIKLELELGRK